MKYPEWAPAILVERHKSRVDSKSSERKFKVSDPESSITELVMKHKGISKEGIENYRRHLYRMSLGLPDKESTALLEQLITDIRMKTVWKALARRSDKDSEYSGFLKACEEGIIGWRGDVKQTASERKAFYQEIRDATAKLFSLIDKADQFDFYSINKLVDDQSVKWLLEVLNAPNNVSHARLSLSDIIPSIYEVLIDISEKATQYGEEESSVKKPNSPNAKIHYFIRWLSKYCQQSYNQPLHEVVAITASVIFNKQNIDTDYVRKLVSNNR